MSFDTTVAQARIQQAAGRLGLTFLQIRSIITYDPAEKTASWRFAKPTGAESIHVGPPVAALDVDLIEMVLRHEFLHRATYNGFSERYDDRELANIVLDICINRLLCEAYYSAMHALSVAIYPEEAKRTVIALADCSADPSVLSHGLEELWHYIWDRNQYGTYQSLNPASLYYRLARIRPRVPETEYILINEGASDSGDSMSPSVKAAVATATTSAGLGASLLGQTLSQYLNVSVRLGAEELIAFLERIEAERLVSDLMSPVREVERFGRNQAYPGIPSARGIALIGAGLAEGWALYHNRVLQEQPQKLAVGMYVDVSGSMTQYFSAIHMLVKAVVNVALALRIFDTEVSPIEPEAFVSGEFNVGGGTDFDPVARDIIDNHEIGSAVILTDGEADLADELSQELARSGKSIYLVMFGSNTPRGPLATHAAEWIAVPDTDP